MSEFSNRFKQLKEESGLTLKDLSEKLNISSPNLSYYMNGREPNYDILIRIADYFHVTIDWLVGRTQTRSSVFESLDKEIKETLIKIDVNDISEDDIAPLSIYENNYLEAQEKLIELMSFYYLILHQLESIQKMHPDYDYSAMNDSLTLNFIESLEYQIDILDEAQQVIFLSKSNSFFEYYFNSLLRIDLISNRLKLIVNNILKIVAANFNGNSDQLSVIADFINNIENYSKNCISNIEMSSYLKKLESYFSQ